MIWIVILGIVLIAISFRFPYWGLIIYMAILYLRPMQTNPELAPYHIARVYAVVTILGFIFNFKKSQKIFLNFRQDKLLLGILIAIILSCATGWIPRCLEILEQMSKNVLVYALIVGMVNTQKRLKSFIWTLLILSGILAFDTIRQLASVNALTFDMGRIGGYSGAYFGDSNDFAVMMNVVIPFAFFASITARPFILRPVSLYLMGLFVTAIVATRTRGGLIAFGLVMLGIMYFGIRASKKWHKVISIILVTITIIGIFVFSPEVFKERAATIVDYKNQETAWTRIENWKLGIKMFLSSPLVGVGAGNYQLRYKDFGGWNNIWMVSHNMYVDVLSELGLIGFICFMLLLFFTLKDSLKSIGEQRKVGRTDSFMYFANQAAILSLVAYCAGGMFLSIFTYPILYIIIAINVAILNIVIKTTY